MTAIAILGTLLLLPDPLDVPKARGA